jgi:hypothetical protein
MVDFCSFVSPTVAEHKAREGLIERVRAITDELWPGSEVRAALAPPRRAETACPMRARA